MSKTNVFWCPTWLFEKKIEFLRLFLKKYQIFTKYEKTRFSRAKHIHEKKIIRKKNFFSRFCFDKKDMVYIFNFVKKLSENNEIWGNVRDFTLPNVIIVYKKVQLWLRTLLRVDLITTGFYKGKNEIWKSKKSQTIATLIVFT